VRGNCNDVWFSRDGRTWTQLKSAVIWSNRHEHSAVVFRDRIWVYGGCGEVLNNEVWTLQLPEGWPIH
jgi:hypothetical protein